MTRKYHLIIVIALLVLLMSASLAIAQMQAPLSTLAQTPLGTAFTYQGHLNSGGGAVNGTCDFQFGLWDAGVNGAQIGSTQTVSSVTVANGLFIVQLDFGSSAFTGDARWLEIAVRCPAGSGTYTTLTPRQSLTAAPYALYSRSAPWSGLTGVPASFADGIDNDTTYSAGTGLTLSGTQFNVDMTTIQARVTGNCTVGRSIRAINATGSVICTAIPAHLAPPAAVLVNALDTAGDVGTDTSITIGTDGLGLISYYDNSNLKVAHCNDVACTTATTAILDFTGFLAGGGQSTSVALGSDGLGLISYYDQINFALKVAHCNDVTCGTATTATVDSNGNVGKFSSVTIGADGLGLISYYNESTGDLKVAHCSNVTCSTATTVTLDSGLGGANVGLWTSVTIRTDGLGLISYYDASGGDLKVANCSDVACSTAITSAVDTFGDVGLYTSVTIGSDGQGLISYWDRGSGDLKVAHCTGGVFCGGVAAATLEGLLVNTGAFTSVTIGPDGLGLISYHDLTNTNLKVAHCNDVACTAASTTIVDGISENVGDYTSVTIGSDGLPLIAYHDTNLDLRAAHCTNAFCVPYFRRR